MSTHYDVNEVIQQFLQNKFQERAELIREIHGALRDSRASKMLLAEVANSAMENRLGPIEGISLGVMYGIVLGILMEKQRIRTMRRIIS